MANHVPELTLKSLVLSVVLSLFMVAASTYLGLKVGISISASIPAAVIAMGILRCFKTHNVFEINMVQTASATGQTLAAGVIFTLPALLLIHYWDVFNYWQSFFIAVVGGFLGVLFAVPLRRVLLNDPNLSFPEGTAIGNVLKIAQDGTVSLKQLIIGGVLGSSIAFIEGGLRIFSSGLQHWTKFSNTVMGFGLGYSPALIGAGYIVGPRVAMSMLSGVILGWLILLPILAPMNPKLYADLSAQNFVYDVWKTQIRFVGLGVLLIAGLWTLITLVKPIISGMATSLHSLAFVKEHGYAQLPKHEQDFPIHWVFAGVIALALPIILILLFSTELTSWMPHGLGAMSTVIFTTIYILFAGFIFACICGYLVGMVGSSASPVSAMGLAAILVYSFTLFIALKFFDFNIDAHTLSLSAMALVVVAFITCISAITNDTMQDLKAGQIINATPWKQQLVMLIGVLVAALTLPLILDLLYNAYGIGDRLPRPEMDLDQTLAAPQAQLMAAIANGVFTQNVSWHYIHLGAGIAVAGIIIDRLIRRYGLSLPTLGIGMGIYLPIESSTALVLGGLVAWFAARRPGYDENSSIMVASGLVAGAALVGVLLAIPFVIFQDTEALRLMPVSLDWLAQILGLATTVGVSYILVKNKK